MEKPNIKFETPYINNNQSFGINGFLEPVFKELAIEINLLRNTIFDSRQEEKYVFALHERTWLGLFNNAILKTFPADRCTTMQEYGVYKGNDYVGRADFLVRWKDVNEKVFYLLFEAKQYEEKSIKKIHDDTEESFEIVRKQGQKYYDAELEFYDKKNVYIITIAFGWIRRKEVLAKAKEYFDNNIPKIDKSSHFCALYYEGDNGMWVYGRIHDPNEIKFIEQHQ